MGLLTHLPIHFPERDMPRGWGGGEGSVSVPWTAQMSEQRPELVSCLHSSGPHGMPERPGEPFSDSRTRTEEALD